MGGSRYKKHSDKKNNNVFINLLLIIFISVMIVSGFKIYSWIKENRLSKNMTNDIRNMVYIDDSLNTIDKYNVDLKSLKQVNSDTIAWFKVNGTNIEYPIVKTNENDFYMTHSFDKTYNTAGWVFMDCNNKFDGTDRNMVVYGHNRRDGSMFGSLKNILNSDWYNNNDNLTIPLITEDGKSEYKVFSVYRIEKEDYYITTNFEDDKEFEKFLDTVKQRSIKDFNEDATSNSNILTLSTCADNNNYRVVLHAIKIK